MTSTAESPAQSQAPSDMASPEESRKGTLYGFLAYASWGLLPIYFHSLEPSSAIEILVHRVVWSLVFCLALGAIVGDRSWVPLLRDTRRLLILGTAAVILGINWGIYIYAVT
ncbi:MAG TPA: hypothetical protein VNZ58_03690, partial [Thermomicrobiales bacterium]|nr:hypothetical protein [Thermomicrobiales bacterium]